MRREYFPEYHPGDYKPPMVMGAPIIHLLYEFRQREI